MAESDSNPGRHGTGPRRGQKMANQRMGFKCVCGAELWVAKHFIGPFYAQTEKIDEFFEEHVWCYENGRRS